MSDLYPIKILDIYSENAFNAAQEKANGMRGVIIKAGQGGYISLPRDYIAQCESVGLPWGVYWVIDSRYDADYHMMAIKSAFLLDQNFGQLGWWWDCEKYDQMNLTDAQYWKTAYAGNALIESIIDKFLLWCGDTGGIYTSPGFASLLGWNSTELQAKSLFGKLALMPLWIAHYGVTTPIIPAPWHDWQLWQYHPEPDWSYFNGDENKFKETFNIPDIVNPPIPINGDVLISQKQYFPGMDYANCHRNTPHGLANYHVMKIDTAKAEFFVSPPRRNYVPRLAEEYHLDFAVNGDGFNAITTAGFGASEGVSYFGQGTEETVYISKANEFSRKRPAEVWNAISHPNDLVVNGAIPQINKSVDDIRARTAFGWTADQKTVYFLWVDGGDYFQKIGLNFFECAAILLDLGCQEAVMNDGGGSTTATVMQNGKAVVIGVPCGEDDVSGYAYPMRAIANIIGVRMKTQPIPQPTGDTMATYQVMKDVRPRSIASVTTSDSGTNIPAGTTFESNTTQVDAITASHPTMVQMPTGKWLPLVYNGVEYVKDITATPPPQPAPAGDTILYADVTVLTADGIQKIVRLIPQ